MPRKKRAGRGLQPEREILRPQSFALGHLQKPFPAVCDQRLRLRDPPLAGDPTGVPQAEFCKGVQTPCAESFRKIRGADRPMWTVGPH
jgi:hypothetical protein